MSNESKFPGGYLSYPAAYNVPTATYHHHHHHHPHHHQQHLTQNAAIPAHFYLSTMQVFQSSLSQHMLKQEPKEEHHDEGNNDSGISPSHYASSESNPSSIGCSRSSSSSHGGSRPSSGNGSMQSPLSDQQQQQQQQSTAFDYSSTTTQSNNPNSVIIQPPPPPPPPPQITTMTATTPSVTALDLRASPSNTAFAPKYEFKSSPASVGSIGDNFDYHGASPPSATAADFDSNNESPASNSITDFDCNSRPSLPASSATGFIDYSSSNTTLNTMTSGIITPPEGSPNSESAKQKRCKTTDGVINNHKAKSRRTNNPAYADDETRNEVVCPICQFRSRKKIDIADHFITHCSLEDDGSEEYNDKRYQVQKRIIMQLEQVGKPKKSKKSQKNKGKTNDNSLEIDQLEHLQNNDSMDGSQNNIDWASEQAEVYTPSFHANGSVKIIRCKQCPIIFICKVTFWKHMHDSHLDKEKAMKCPKCPFATQLKHHMEYHLNNHSGWKPFQCKLCDYVCVSKSMLSSHMKSHSDVHQFRCATCGYTTKYLHSLKMHLKTKPDHVQDIVLNSDGTQNPYCIIDVYGKKRGPRSKLKSISTPVVQVVPQTPEPQLPASSPNSSAMDTSSVGSPPSTNSLSPYNQAFNLMLAYSNLNYPAPSPGTTAPLLPFNEPQEMARLNERLQAQITQEYMANILRSQHQRQTENLRLRNQLVQSPVEPSRETLENEGPVDLRSSEEINGGSSVTVVQQSVQQEQQQQKQQQQQDTPTSRLIAPRPPNRRKGLAVKLSKRTVQADSDSETEDAQKKIKHGSPPPASAAPIMSSAVSYSQQSGASIKSPAETIRNMTCPICPYPIPSNLFILHMTAHDPECPLRCNKCGEVSGDGLAFYNHISLRGIDHGK